MLVTLDLTKHLSELAGRVWVPRAIEDALAVPWVPVLLLGVLGAVLLWRAYWRLYRSTAIPVVRVFILIGYLLVAQAQAPNRHKFPRLFRVWTGLTRTTSAHVQGTCDEEC